jgi:hypothetical protein
LPIPLPLLPDILVSLIIAKKVLTTILIQPLAGAAEFQGRHKTGKTVSPTPC